MKGHLLDRFTLLFTLPTLVRSLLALIALTNIFLSTRIFLGFQVFLRYEQEIHLFPFYPFRLLFTLGVDNLIDELLIEHVINLFKAFLAVILELTADALNLVDALLTVLSDLDFWENVEVKHPSLLVLHSVFSRIDFDDLHADLFCLAWVYRLLVVLLNLGFHGLDRIEAHHLVPNLDPLVQVLYLENVLMPSVFKSFVEDVAHDVIGRQIVLALLRLLNRVLVGVEGVRMISYFDWMVWVEHLLVIRNYPWGRGLQLLLELQLLPNVSSLALLPLNFLGRLLAIDLKPVVLRETSSGARLTVISIWVRDPP